jgi:hypothetical protein
MEAAFWLLAPLLLVLGLYVFSRQSRRRRTKAEWDQLPAAAGYNPLQEFVDPASRHAVEVAEQDVTDDDRAGE